MAGNNVRLEKSFDFIPLHVFKKTYGGNPTDEVHDVVGVCIPCGAHGVLETTPRHASWDTPRALAQNSGTGPDVSF